MLYLIIIFTVLFFILAWRRLDLALMFLIAALPAYLIRFNIFGLPATLLEVMIWVVFIVWFLKNYRHIIENLKSARTNVRSDGFKIKHSFKIQNSKFKIIYRYPFDWEIILLLLIALAAVGAAGFSSGSFGIWKAYFFEPALLFVVVLNVMKNPPRPPLLKGVELILWPLAISVLAVSALAIFQKITGQLIDNPLWAAAETRRVVSFFGYPNAVGLYLGPVALVMAGWLFSVILEGAPATDRIPLRSYRSFQSLQDDKLKAILINLIIILSILSIYFAKSKGALTGVAAGLIVFGLLAGKKIRWAVIIFLILMSAGLAFNQPAKLQALKYVTLNDFSGQVRRAQWRETLTMLKDGRVLTGVGLANYQATVANYHVPGIFIKDFDDPAAQRKLVFNPAYRAAHWQPLEIYLYPHNILLNFWSELGLAGVLLFIWIIGKYLVIGIWNLFGHWDLEFGNLETQKNKYIVLGLLGAMAVIVIHGVVDVPYFKNDLAAMFWLLVAMMSLINLENKSNLP